MAKRRFRSRGRFTRVRRRRRTGGRRTKRFIKAVVRRMCETKYAVSSANAAVDAALGYLADITPTFAQGVDKNQRLGNRIKYKYLQLRYWLYTQRYSAGLGTIDPNLIVRLIVFQTRLPMTDPLPTNKLNLTLLFTQSNVLSSINNTGVRVLKDKTIRMAAYYSTAPQNFAPSLVAGKLKLRVNNNVNFQAAADVLPQDPKDRYYILAVTSEANLTTMGLSISWFNRLSFIDM